LVGMGRGGVAVTVCNFKGNVNHYCS
jgi:hypothetical protein